MFGNTNKELEEAFNGQPTASNPVEAVVSDELPEVQATLSISMYVDCPNEDCGNYINILDERDTNHHDHNDCGELLQQMFPKNGSHDDFECEKVTCSQCKTEFNVKGLKW